MDSNKTAGEEARRQLHKNAASNLEQVLAATPTRHQLYGHLPPITKTIQVRRSRNAGHCWRSRDELISDVLLWTPTHGRAKAGRPARTYIQQLCEDTGCCPDLPEAMDDREKWRERVRDIRASSMMMMKYTTIFISKCNIPMIRICEIDIGNLKTRNSRNWFRYETFIHLFEFKGFLT